MRSRSRLALALGATLVAALGAAPLASAAASGSSTYTPPKIKHVWNIILENKSYEAAFTGLNQNSYLWKTLPTYGLLERQYYGTGHFSQDNYLSMVSGQGASPGPRGRLPALQRDRAGGQGRRRPVQDQGPHAGRGRHLLRRLDPAGLRLPPEVPTLFNQFDAKGVSYKGYMQDMGNDPAREPATCGNPLGSQPGPAVVDPGSSEGPYAAPGSIESPSATPDDAYVAKHNPFVWFHSLLDNGDCAKHVVPLAKNLLQDLSSSATTPAFSFITPNNCSDAHDATCKGDNLSGGSNALTGVKKTPLNTQGGLTPPTCSCSK